MRQGNLQLEKYLEQRIWRNRKRTEEEQNVTGIVEKHGEIEGSTCKTKKEGIGNHVVESGAPQHLFNSATLTFSSPAHLDSID
jgi:hypothetical protein